MEALIRLFGDLCRFKSGPENVPSSANLFIVLLITNFVVETLLGLSVYSLWQSGMLAGLSVFFLLVFTWFWLKMFKLGNRFLQTAIAFVGVSLFANILCFVPILFLWKMNILSNDSYAMINLMLIFWLLSIYAHIYKNALNISFFLGFALAITYFITFNTISINILGV